MRTNPAGKDGKLRNPRGILLAGLFVCGVFGMWMMASGRGLGQSATSQDGHAAAARFPTMASFLRGDSGTAADSGKDADADLDPMSGWAGLPVRGIAFEGVTASRLAPLPEHLAQGIGKPLNLEELQRSLRQLYASGL